MDYAVLQKCFLINLFEKKKKIEGVDWLTNYQMSVVTFKIFIYEIIGAIPQLDGY